LADRHQLSFEVREIPLAELRAADEIWMTSSPKEILAITTLDGVPVGDGLPGPVGKLMWQWYQHFKTTVMRHG
jgi:D-alanine transaminase